MLVAMSSQRANAFLITNCNAFAGGNFADATQLDFRKLRLPGIEQRDGVFTRDSEQQLEVLAVGERSEQGRLGGRFNFGGTPRLAADRNGRRMKLRAYPACFQNVPQVACETVADIEHRVN